MFIIAATNMAKYERILKKQFNFSQADYIMHRISQSQYLVVNIN